MYQVPYSTLCCSKVLVMIAWYQINLMFWTIRFFTKLIDELCGLFILIFSTLCGYIATYKDMTNLTFCSSVIFNVLQ